MHRIRGLRAALTAMVVVAGTVLAGPAATASAAGGPQVSIVDPAGGAAVKGTVAVTATGTVDPAGLDSPDKMVLYVDGASVDSAYCPSDAPDPDVCTLTQHWDATGVTGGHIFTVKFTTSAGAAATSAPVSVTVTSPGPQAGITNPTGGTVQGDVAVTATGAVDPSQSDSPNAMVLYVDGASVDSAYCPNDPIDPRACTVTLHWNASGITGSHGLRVKFSTARGNTVNSPTVTVTVTSPAPQVSITSPLAGASVRGGVAVTATGSVDPSQSDSPDGMVLYVDGASVDSGYCPNDPIDPHTCTVTLLWNATGVTGNHTLLVKFSTTAGNSATSAPVGVLVASPGPQVAISSPTAGSTVVGTVAVAVTGSTDASQSDSPDAMRLYVDGTPVDSQYCPSDPVDPRTCTLTLHWNATGVSGAHALVAVFATSAGNTATSTAVTVNVVSPPPTVTITSPVGGSTVRGTVSVSAVGAIDASQTDFPNELRLYVDGAPVDSQYCPSDPIVAGTCPATLSWSAGGLVGAHTLVASFSTSNGLTVSGAPVTVTAFSSSRTTLNPVPTTSAGHRMLASGLVRTVGGGNPIRHARVVVTFTPASGAKARTTVFTDALGRFAAALPVLFSGTVAADVAADASWGASSSRAPVRVLAPVTCTVPPSVAVKARFLYACRAPHLPSGTSVTLQYKYGGQWHNLGHGRSPASGSFSFTVWFNGPGTTYVRVVLGTSHLYAKTVGPALRVAVH